MARRESGVSEMIERVTKAIVRARHPGLEESEIDNEDSHYWWGLSVDEARAAIEAMREPTEVMVVAADAFDQGNAGIEECKDIYRAMVDAALAKR